MKIIRFLHAMWSDVWSQIRPDIGSYCMFGGWLITSIICYPVLWYFGGIHLCVIVSLMIPLLLIGVIASAMLVAMAVWLLLIWVYECWNRSK